MNLDKPFFKLGGTNVMVQLGDRVFAPVTVFRGFGLHGDIVTDVDWVPVIVCEDRTAYSETEKRYYPLDQCSLSPTVITI